MKKNNKPFQLKASYQPAGHQPEAIETLSQGVQSGMKHQVLLGVTGAGKTFTMAHVIQNVQRPTVIIAPNKTLAAQLYGELKDYFPNNAVEYFVSYYDYYQPEAYVPSTDTFIEKDASINAYVEQMRLSATKALMERRDTVVVATVSAIYGLGDPQSYLSMMLHISQGEQIDQRSILRRLADLQYTRSDLVLERGKYRVRGDIIDVYPAESDQYAIRIQLFDEEIEQILVIDPLTSEIKRSLPRVTIYPKTHYVTPRKVILKTVEAIKSELAVELEKLYAQNKLVEAQRLEQRTRFDIEMLLELNYCSGVENYSRYLSGRQAGQPPPTLFSYLSLQGEALLMIDESHVTIPQLGGMYRGDRARKETLVLHGFRLPSALDNRPLRFEEFVELSPQTLYVSATPGAYELEHGKSQGNIVELVVRPTGLLDPGIVVRPVSTQVDDLLSEIHDRVQKNERVLVTTLTKRMAEDLTDYFSDQGIKVRYLHSDVDTIERVEIIRDLRLGSFDVLIGINLLREGLDIPEVSLVAILDADKEGFLRSDRSLIQTIGRAARNLHGKAILYADKVTRSMDRAIKETERRRHIQLEFNKQHGITPSGIKKAVKDIMQGAHDAGHAKKTGKQSRKQASKSQRSEEVLMTPEQAGKYMNQLEKEMLKHAENLEFEEAALIRDRIAKIKKEIL